MKSKENFLNLLLVHSISVYSTKKSLRWLNNWVESFGIVRKLVIATITDQVIEKYGNLLNIILNFL